MTVVPLEVPSLPPTGHSTSTSSSSGSSFSNQTLNQTPQSELSLLISQLAQKYAGDTYNWAQSTIAPDAALTNEVVGNYLNSSKLSAQQAAQLGAQYQNQYVPEMRNLTDLAGSYSSAARQKFNAGYAAANSIQGSQAGINNSMATLQGYGVNPSAGSFGQLLASQKVAQGAQAAAAGTQAAMKTGAYGRQLLQTDVGVGEQLPGASVNATNAASTANSGAENAKLGNTSTTAGALATPNSYLSTAQNLDNPQVTTNSGSNQSSSSYSTNYTQAGTENWEGNWNPNPKNGAPGHYAEGGPAIPDDSSIDLSDPRNQTQGGHIDPQMSPSQGAITDDVNAHVNANEFVIPKDVSLWVGQKALQKLIMQARQEMQAPGLARPDTSGASPMDKGQAQFVSKGAEPSPPAAARGGRMPSRQQQLNMTAQGSTPPITMPQPGMAHGGAIPA